MLTIKQFITLQRAALFIAATALVLSACREEAPSDAAPVTSTLRPQLPMPPTGEAERPTLTLSEDAVLQAVLRGTQARSSTTAVEPSQGHGGAVGSVRLFAGGDVLGAGWARSDDPLAAVEHAAGEAFAQAGDSTPQQFVEVCVCDRFRPVPQNVPQSRPLTNAHRGVRGLLLSTGEREGFIGPLQMIAENTSFAEAVERWRDREIAGSMELDPEPVQLRYGECRQFLVDLAAETLVELQRGNQPVELEEIDRDFVIRLQERLTAYLVNNSDQSDRIAYLLRPEGPDGSGLDNVIRQWLASAALAGRAADSREPALIDASRRNIARNLSDHYVEDGDLGLIRRFEEVKLGSLALAALTIHESPSRADFAEEEAALRRTIEHLCRDDGVFETHYPIGSGSSGQNFYPGEALVYLTRVYAEEGLSSPVRAKLQRTFEHYRDWHLDPKNRNPAFVPWHTQAWHQLWILTKDPELAVFIFEMNDWLLRMQQWDSVPYPDMLGRFYDASKPAFGPPHASSTGVYLEGLADAYVLAKELGEAAREAAYREAILRGLRSLGQLTFDSEEELYFVRERDRYLGGVRTRVYDNNVRVDNVAHALLALRKLIPLIDDVEAWSSSGDKQP